VHLLQLLPQARAGRCIHPHFEQIGEKIEELLAIGGTQILMQGGLVPDADAPDRRGPAV
jgi:2-iminoacetate synthase ThiH